MKTTRRGLFGLFGGAAVVAYTKQLPSVAEPIVDTAHIPDYIYSSKEYFDYVQDATRYHNFSDIIMETLIKQSHKVNENISKNNALLLRIQNKKSLT